MIEAMKQALEALESQRFSKVIDATNALRQAIAEAEKPCKYCHGTGDVHDQTGEWRGLCVCEAGKAEKQEPVAWMTETGSVWKTREKNTDIPLYTHPQPKREWVGLTEKEIIVIAQKSKEYAEYVTPQGLEWFDVFIQHFAKQIQNSEK
jgi:hypothetical protein